jgi:glycosyltransferase involved in cell wall biosynthesis
MRISIFFSSDPSSGGAYQYQTTFLEILKKRKDDDVVIITSNKQIILKYCNDLQILDLSIVSRLFTPLKFIFSFLRKIGNNKKGVTDKGNQKINHIKKSGIKEKTYYQLLRLLLVIKGIKLIIYPGPFEMSFKLKIPYVFTVYDLQHRIQPEFPEVSINGVFEEREYLYSNALPNAVAVIADSQVGKEDIVDLYHTNQDKIFVFQHLPSTYLNNKLTLNELNNVKSEYNLPDTYIFYPANFWHHKNHQLIIKAIAILNEKNIFIHAVFVGSKMDKWNGYKKAMDLARDLNVIDQIRYLGYVENEEMSALYKLSIGLVMPTFFGPSNIPYLEAFYLDCPVITSDIRGIREQVKDAAILVNPTSPEELAKAIVKLLNDEELRNRLIKNGHKVLNSWTYNDFSNELNRLLDYCTEKVNEK